MIKILDNTEIEIPDAGNQNRQNLSSPENQEHFNFIINRKGHIKTKLTYIMNSKSIGNMVRIDMEGSSHPNPNGAEIPTPHVHIFDENHKNGKIAVALSDLKKTPLGEDIAESLVFFLEYNNVDMNGIAIPMV